MMTIHQQIITDKIGNPIAVVIDYSDWLEIENMIEESLQLPKNSAQQRISWLGKEKGVIIPDDFNGELPDSFWLGSENV